MPILKTYIAPKNAFIGLIIGVSVGLGTINLDTCPLFGLAGALLFGVKKTNGKNHGEHHVRTW
jgi:hypothetical protein